MSRVLFPEVRTLAVVGAGTMGVGIAQLAAQSGVAVLLYDSVPAAREGALGRLKAAIEKGAASGRLTRAEADRALGRIGVADGLAGLAGADAAIEAVSEELALKKDLFVELGRLFPKPHALLGTNTSSLPVAAIAEGVPHGSRVIGMHFFNPPVAMRLVELIRHPGASAEAFAAARALALKLRREPVPVADRPGFLVNRVVRSYYLVAQRLAAEGAGSFAELDAAVKARGGVPMGPFELMDFIGLEVNLAITRAIYEGLGKPERLAPHPIQERLVASGGRGRKSGRGFYLYGDGAPRENPEALALLPAERRPLEAEAVWGRIMGAILGEAELVVREGVADKGGVDTAVRLAMNFPQGPFEWRRAHGLPA